MTPPLPASLRRVLDRQNATPKGPQTWVMRDGTIIRELPDGRLIKFPSIDPLPSK